MRDENEFVIYVRKKPKNPVWLAEHQKRLKIAATEAAEETKNLKGQARIRAMNQLVKTKMKEKREREG